MTKVTTIGDCGNSPKNLLAERAGIALATGEGEEVAALVSDDVEFATADGRLVHGKADLLAFVDSQERPKAVTMLSALTHGKAGAVNAHVTFRGGESRGVCYMLQFASVKADMLTRITCYQRTAS